MSRQKEHMILYCLEGEHKGSSCYVFDGSILGRSSDSVLQLSDQMLGRIHCRFFVHNGQWSIKVYSLNGGKIGDQYLKAGEEFPLTVGSELTIVQEKFLFTAKKPAPKQRLLQKMLNCARRLFHGHIFLIQ